jgi:hypothetical protein
MAKAHQAPGLISVGYFSVFFCISNVKICLIFVNYVISFDSGRYTKELHSFFLLEYAEPVKRN